jgi:hypothetical protein
MTSVDDLLRALPIRGIKTRCGTYGNCAGVAFTRVDLEPGTSEGFVVVDALTGLEDWRDDFGDMLEERVESVGAGVRARFRELYGFEPAVRVLVRWVNPNPTHTTDSLNQRAGRLVVEEAVRLAGEATS